MLKRTPLYRSNFREATNIAAVSSLDEMKELVDALYNQDRLIGFDIETGYLGSDYPKRSFNMYHPDQLIAGFSITNDPTWARYVPLRHDFANNLDPNEVWTLMKPLLEEKPKVAHNVQFEAENLLQLDKKGDGPRINIFASPVHDSMIQAFTLSDVPPMNIDGSLDGGKYVEAFLPPFHRTDDMFAAPNLKWFNVGLKDLTRFRYNYEQNDIFTLFNGGKPLTQKQKDSIRFNTLPVDSKVIRYAGDDAYLCLMLHYDQIERINEDPYLPNVYQLEMQIAELLVEIREVGVAVDWEGIAEHKQIFETFSHNMRVSTKEKFEEEVGRELIDLNLNSPVQIRKLIFDSPEEGGMGLTTERTTKSGLLSTDDQALTNLRQMSPAIDSLLKYRQCVKMGKWFDQWDELSSQYEDRRLHPSFNQVQVQSGRFASSNPNCQNITKRWWYQNVPGSAADIMSTGKQGSEYWTGNARDFIKASEGYTLLSFDYKSAEIQMLAALSRETEIIKAFYADEDFHKWTASLVFGKPIEEVTKNERQAAKTTAFATIYGQSVGAMAQQLGVSREEAQRIRDLYFSRFPRLAQYIEDQHAMAQNECEVRTWLGRRATIWENMHPTRAVRSKAARMSVNIPVQGGATGDYPKLAMIRVRKLLKSLGWWNGMVRLLMNQHDSLVFEVSNQLDLQEVIDLLTPQVQFSLAGIQNCFNQFDTFPPMSVDWEAGKRWGSIVSIEDLPILDAHEFVVELAEDATADDLKAVKGVLVSSPGDVPVVLKVRGKEIRDKFKVAATPSILTRLKKGDSDLGIYHAIGDKVKAEFLVPA